MEQLNLHMKIFDRIGFTLVRFFYYGQTLISWLFWKFCSLVIYIAWRSFGEEDNNRIIKFKKNSFVQYHYGRFVKLLIKWNGNISGLRNKFIAYESLLSWNPAYPLVMLKHKESTYNLFFLGVEKEKGKGRYPIDDALLLGTAKKAGNIAIIAKEIVSNSIIIKCVWLTGDHVGKIFEIKDDSFLNENELLPDALYFPPKSLVLVLDILGSATLILAAISITHYVFTYMKEGMLHKIILNFINTLMSIYHHIEGMLITL